MQWIYLVWLSRDKNNRKWVINGGLFSIQWIRNREHFICCLSIFFRLSFVSSVFVCCWITSVFFCFFVLFSQIATDGRYYYAVLRLYISHIQRGYWWLNWFRCLISSSNGISISQPKKIVFCWFSNGNFYWLYKDWF